MGSKPQQVSVNGVVLGYQVYGDPAGKPPFVFVHGYSMRSASGLYDDLLGPLTERYAVYAVDLRGHGLSADARSGGWSREALADDLLAFVDALQLRAPVYAGHSFGGELGLFTAIRHPAIFSKLCLLAPGPADQRRDPVTALQYLVDHGRDKDVLRDLFSHMYAHPSPGILELTVDATALVDPSIHRAQSEANARFSIDDRLGEVSVPVLLVAAEDDDVVSPLVQHDMAEKLPDCTEVVLPGEGHMAPIESAPLVVEAMLDFLGRESEPTAAR